MTAAKPDTCHSHAELMAFALPMLIAAWLLSIAIPLHAKDGNDVLKDMHFSGTAALKASATTQDGASPHTNFELRVVNLNLLGRVGDFSYRFHLSTSGIGTNSDKNGPRFGDAWIEWDKYEALRIRAGQMKVPFSFETRLGSWTWWFGGPSQAVNRFTGYSDRNTGLKSLGRDIGVQLLGSLLKADDGHHYLSYEVALLSGNGVNSSDNNNHKDLAGGINISPFMGLDIGLWGWNGRFTSDDGITVDRKRWAAGVSYSGPVMVMAEYIHSYGHKVSDWDAATGKWKADTGAKSQGWYVQAGIPVTKDDNLWLHAKVDSYDDYLHLGHSMNTTLYGLSADYFFNDNIKVQLNLYGVDDKASKHNGGDGHYMNADLQLYFHF